MNISNTADYSGGLNTLTDSAKLQPGQYSLLVNGRTRGNTIAPTYKHLRIALPVEGTIQCVFAQGTTLFVFIAGIAYSAVLQANRPIILRAIAGWTPMESTVQQIFVETVPATWNVLKRVSSSPNDTAAVFTGSVAAFRECIVVQDGVNIPRAIFPDGTWTTLGSYNEWTFDNPLYVPIGKQMAYSGGKLYVAAVDGLSIYQSVSGRPTDFMINIDNDGNKQGDVQTTSIGVSYAPITFMKGAESGSLIVATLYSTFMLVPNTAYLLWGEPYITPVEQFPVGFLNNQCYADISGDTAFLTQSGVQSFNVTKQLRIASNNQPIGAPISSILSKPQSITAAAINFDDYALFGLNTIFGPLTAVYDTMVGHYVSLDNSFGTVKYFARILTENTQQLVFARDDDQLYLAYGDPLAVNVTAAYLGDFVARDPRTGVATGMFMRAMGLKLSFIDVQSSGEVSIQVFADKKLIYSATQTITAIASIDENSTQPFPYTSRQTTNPLSFKFSEQVQGWKLGVYVSWNCNATLSEAALDGDMSTRDDLSLKGLTTTVTPDVFAAVGHIELGLNLADGGSDPAGRPFQTVKGEWYLFDPVDTITTVIDGGKLRSKREIYKSDGLAMVFGDNIKTFSFRNVDTVKRLVDQIAADGATTLVGLGDFTSDTTRDIDDTIYVIQSANLSFQSALGNFDNDNKEYFCAKTGTRYPYTKDYQFTTWAFYNSYANYMGYTPGSIQDKWIERAFNDSAKRFKFVAIHKSAYTTANDIYPGTSNVRLDYSDKQVDGVFSAQSNVAEYLVRAGVNYFTNGLGGSIPTAFRAGTDSEVEFRTNDVEAAYYLVSVDNINATVTLKDIDGTPIGSKVIYG